MSRRVMHDGWCMHWDDQSAGVCDCTPKSKGVVYISGPMRGYPEDNYPAFNTAAAAFRAAGWLVRNPADNFHGAHDKTFAEYMRVDIKDLLESTAIALLPGWEDSVGARTELLIARTLGLEVYDALTMDHTQPPYDPHVHTVVAWEPQPRKPLVLSDTREPV